MSELVAVSVSYPAIVLTILVGLAIVYWLFVIMGALDIDVGADADVDAGIDVDAGVDVHAGADADADVDVDAHGHGFGLSAIMSALGLGKVPITITFSFVSLFAWIICILLVSAVGDIGLPGWLLGTLILVGSLLLALPPTALLARPLGPLFAIHKSKARADYIGSVCTVTTGEVTAKFGQARILGDGNDLIIQVRCDRGDVFERHDKALIIAHDDDRDAFLIEKMDDVLGERTEAPPPNGQQ